MGKNARVDGRRLAYDQMKAECRQGLLLANLGLGRTTRQCISEDDIVSFKTAIDKNNTSYFGLAKLRKLDVDVLFEEDNHKITLIQYASVRKRDKIVINLLRANANPLIRSKESLFTMLEPQQRKHFLQKIGCFLSSLNLRYLTYILHQVVGIRSSGRKKFAGGLDTATKFTCSGCNKQNGLDEACILNCCERHVLCEYCLWQRVLESNPMNDIEPLSVCPLCDRNEGSFILRNIDATINNICSKTLFSTNIEESKRAFYSLPPDKLSLKENLVMRKSKENINKGMQKATLRKLLIGETQKKRAEMYFEAIDTGNFLRLVHILNRGIDIDIVDENGESGLLKAAFHVPRELLEHVVGKNHRNLFNAIFLLVANAIDTGEMHRKLNFLYTFQVLLAFGANYDMRSNFGIGAQDCVSMLNTELSQNVMEQMVYNGAEEIDVSAVRSASNCNISLPPNHPAKNLSFTIDKAFSEAFLSRLVDLYESMPLENQDRRDQEKKRYSDTCARRKFFRERGTMWISRTIEYVLSQLKSYLVERNSSLSCGYTKLPCCCFPRMRFLNYQNPGGMMRPHVDLSKSHLFRKEEAVMFPCDRQSMIVESTFTFILYLTDCNDGGETVFLRRLSDKMDCRNPKSGIDEGSSNIISRVKPKRGRLLIFPHDAPHAGAPVGQEVPKLFLRGELC